MPEDMEICLAVYALEKYEKDNNIEIEVTD